MKKDLQNKYKAQAQIMKALSHPTRLFIVEQLATKNLYVKEITKLVGVDISTISKHLSVLKNAGIIDSQKKGTSIYYNLKMKCVLGFFLCITNVLENNYNEYKLILD